MTADMLAAIRVRIEAVGWSETARRSGLHRVTLHRAFGDTRRPQAKRGPKGPGFDTIAAVLPHIGLRLTLEAAE